MVNKMIAIETVEENRRKLRLVIGTTLENMKVTKIGGVQSNVQQTTTQNKNTKASNKATQSKDAKNTNGKEQPTANDKQQPIQQPKPVGPSKDHIEIRRGNSIFKVVADKVQNKTIIDLDADDANIKIANTLINHKPELFTAFLSYLNEEGIEMQLKAELKHILNAINIGFKDILDDKTLVTEASAKIIAAELKAFVTADIARLDKYSIEVI